MPWQCRKRYLLCVPHNSLIPAQRSPESGILIWQSACHNLKSGMAVSKTADGYKEKISESTNAFNDEVQPINIQLEGQTIRLTGNADEMFTQWRVLLKSIYIDETGLNSLKSSTN